MDYSDGFKMQLMYRTRQAWLSSLEKVLLDRRRDPPKLRVREDQKNNIHWQITRKENMKNAANKYCCFNGQNN